MKTIMSVALILLISACSSTSKDIDSITRAKAIKSANEYCASKNKTVEIIEVTQKEMASSNKAQSEVNFKCIDQI